MKATVLLAYGFVAIACPADELTQKLEATILRFLLPYFESAKVRNLKLTLLQIKLLAIFQEVVVKQSLLQTATLIAQAVHPSHLKKEYHFAYRPQLLNFIKVSFKNFCYCRKFRNQTFF